MCRGRPRPPPHGLPADSPAVFRTAPTSSTTRWAAFLALALADTGREREALSPHLPRYQRSLGNYARDLREPGEPGEGVASAQWLQCSVRPA